VDLVALFYTYVISLLGALVFMAGVFAIGRRIHRYDVVDVAWGLVFIVISAISLLLSDTIRLTNILVFILVVVWGLRLSSHIYRRLRSTTSEDKRYVELRKKWQSGNESVAIFFRIYMVQALLATIICLPVIIVNAVNVDAVTFFALAGTVIWAIGFSVESLADQQLRQFIRDPHDKGQLMTHGLWRYSRHPNYFGELALWWGVGIIALGVPFGWIGLIGPLLISYLIIFVSGIPPTEKAFAGRKGWDEYKRRTSILIPWRVRQR
jgi:steroid 5-alpha reductase family enzyme